ncbi:MAG: LysR family transcriptional regulator [Pseudomonadota bacterium]|nr:LysR family transcriptional regulator [Pseudomonadota bacterium]
MEMQQIRYFLALAETLNFTRAAEKCNVTQPALTRAIQGLEGELGGPLFHRERQNTHLSELGRMMHPYFEQICHQARDAKETAKAFGRLDKASLKIGAMCTIGPHIVSSFIAKFCIAYPEIDISLIDVSARALVQKLIDGELEIALFGLPEGLDTRFHGLPLFRERFVLVVPREHRLAKLNVVPCKELHGEPYINRANCEYYDFVHEQFISQGIRTRKVFSSERDDWVQGMIKAGMGIGYFPELSVTDPDLVACPLIEPEFSRTIMLVTVRGRPHSPAVGAFVRQARAERWTNRESALSGC